MRLTMRLRIDTIIKLPDGKAFIPKNWFGPQYLEDVEMTDEIVLDPKYEKYKSFDEIPGPKSYYLFGTLPHYFAPKSKYCFKKLDQTYEKMYHEFGNIVKETIFKHRVLVHLFDPKDMHAVYRHEGQFPNRVSHRALAKYRRERPEYYSGPGLFPSNNIEWQRIRELFSNPLFDRDNQDAFEEALEEVADDLVKTIFPRLDCKGELDVLPLLYRFGLESIGYATLARRLGCLSEEGNEYADALVQAAEDTHLAVYRTENIPFNKKRNYQKLVSAQDILSKILSKHMKDALDLKSKTDNGKTCIAKEFRKIASERDVYTMISDFFLAGIDTTAYALVYSLYHLARNKSAQSTLRSELEKAYPDKDAPMAKLKRPRYLRSVLSEVMRLNPVAIGTGRILNKSMVLSGYFVPAGTMVILQHQVASRQEKYFRDAKVFSPERWVLRETPNIVSAPFGGGRRLCFGRHIAQMEIYLALAKIIRNYEISYNYDEVSTENRLINVPEKPIKIHFEKI